MKPLAFAVVATYLVATIVLGVLAGRRGRGDAND
jgi:solute:Na+ symporter, SSS family